MHGYTDTQICPDTHSKDTRIHRYIDTRIQGYRYTDTTVNGNTNEDDVQRSMQEVGY